MTEQIIGKKMYDSADYSCYHMEFDKMDPVFTPAINFCSDEYVKDATEQIKELFGDAIRGLKDNYELIADVIDMNLTEEYGQYEFTDDFEMTFKVGAEPTVAGSLRFGTSISDALVLQYYEESDPVKAAFGTELSFDQWK